MLHPVLARDTHVLGTFPCCEVLLHRNACVPWLILVPPTEQQEFLDLPEPLRRTVTAEAAQAAAFVRAQFAVTKINFAAIGNVVPQLHLHVVGRHEDDTCWPQPVWGHLDASRTYTTTALAELRAAFIAMGAQDGRS